MLLFMQPFPNHAAKWHLLSVGLRPQLHWELGTKLLHQPTHRYHHPTLSPQHGVYLLLVFSLCHRFCTKERKAPRSLPPVFPSWLFVHTCDCRAGWKHVVCWARPGASSGGMSVMPEWLKCHSIAVYHWVKGKYQHQPWRTNLAAKDSHTAGHRKPGSGGFQTITALRYRCAPV